MTALLLSEVLLAKVTTGAGDGGYTGLLGDERPPKYHPRIEALGDVDEANFLPWRLRAPWLGRGSAANLIRELSVRPIHGDGPISQLHLAPHTDSRPRVTEENGPHGLKDNIEEMKAQVEVEKPLHRARRFHPPARRSIWPGR